MTATSARRPDPRDRVRAVLRPRHPAVGVDLLIAESGVAKATFYKHFPAKDELVLAYLDQVDLIWSAQLRSAAERPVGPRTPSCVGMFDALATAVPA